MEFIKSWLAPRRDGDEPLPVIDGVFDAVGNIAESLMDKVFPGEPPGYSHEERLVFSKGENGKTHYEKVVVVGEQKLRQLRQQSPGEVDRLAQEGKLYVLRRERE